MRNQIRSSACTAFCSPALLLAPAPASAQFMSRSLDDPAVGEKYFIEGSGIWGSGRSRQRCDLQRGHSTSSARTSTSSVISGCGSQVQRISRRRCGRHRSISCGSSTSRSDYQQDNDRSPAISSSTASAIASACRSTRLLDWKAFRFGYEYDAFYRSRGFIGFVARREVHRRRLPSCQPAADQREFAHAKAPIPSIGGIGRYYFLPNISVTGELTRHQDPGQHLERLQRRTTSTSISTGQ